MAPIDLYVHYVSAPCRAVIMTAKILGIEANYHVVDLMTGEQNKPEFIKMNPDHCVPTLADDGFHLWESRPIAEYLVDKFAPDNALYPKDLQKRAHIHRLMDFDMGTVYKAIGTYVYPIAFEGKKASADEMEAMMKRLNDTVFHDKPYAAGDNMTLADLFLITTFTFPEIVGYEISAEKFPNLGAWVKRMKDSDQYKKNNTEFEELKEQFKAKLAQK